MVKTDISRQVKLDRNEMKIFKKNAIVSVSNFGNNWTNLKTNTRIQDILDKQGSFDMYRENYDLLGEYDVTLTAEDTAVSLHNYHGENICYYEEQECHCATDQLFRVIRVEAILEEREWDGDEYSDDPREIIGFEIKLEPINNLDIIDENTDCYYEINDRLYLSLFKGYDEEEIEEKMKQKI